MATDVEQHLLNVFRSLRGTGKEVLSADFHYRDNFPHNPTTYCQRVELRGGEAVGRAQEVQQPAPHARQT